MISWVKINEGCLFLLLASQQKCKLHESWAFTLFTFPALRTVPDIYFHQFLLKK